MRRTTPVEPFEPLEPYEPAEWWRSRFESCPCCPFNRELFSLILARPARLPI